MASHLLWPIFRENLSVLWRAMDMLSDHYTLLKLWVAEVIVIFNKHSSSCTDIYLKQKPVDAYYWDTQGADTVVSCQSPLGHPGSG